MTGQETGRTHLARGVRSQNQVLTKQPGRNPLLSLVVRRLSRKEKRKLNLAKGVTGLRLDRVVIAPGVDEPIVALGIDNIVALGGLIKSRCQVVG